jgi:hypothetical protein
MSEYINILVDGAETGVLFLMFLMIILLAFVAIYDCRKMDLYDIYTEIFSFLKILLVICFVTAVVIIVGTFVGVILNMVVQFLPLVIL